MNLLVCNRARFICSVGGTPIDGFRISDVLFPAMFRFKIYGYSALHL